MEISITRTAVGRILITFVFLVFLALPMPQTGVALNYFPSRIVSPYTLDLKASGELYTPMLPKTPNQKTIRFERVDLRMPTYDTELSDEVRKVLDRDLREHQRIAASSKTCAGTSETTPVSMINSD